MTLYKVSLPTGYESSQEYFFTSDTKPTKEQILSSILVDIENKNELNTEKIVLSLQALEKVKESEFVKKDKFGITQVEFKLDEYPEETFELSISKVNVIKL